MDWIEVIFIVWILKVRTGRMESNGIYYINVWNGMESQLDIFL